MRKRLAPEIHDSFTAFTRRVFAEGALPTRTKQLIAVAVAHVTQCPYCMRAGGAYAHANIAMRAISEMTSNNPVTAGHGA